MIANIIVLLLYYDSLTNFNNTIAFKYIYLLDLDDH